jgi:lysophospholipase L1-like esterase
MTVIIHCGTNGVKDKKQKYVLCQIKYLIHEIKERSRITRFVISSIIPRPRDFDKSNSIIRRVNQVLKIWTEGNPSVHFLPSFKAFLKGARIRTDQDLYAEDGLQLNQRGIARMARILRNIISLFSQGRLNIHQ